jgi:hypothetical protein
MKYRVFISLLIDGYADKIIAGLFKMGFEISPIENEYILYNANSLCSLFAMSVGTKNTNAGLLRDCICKFLDLAHISYYSLIVVEENSSVAWSGSNISINVLKRKPKVDVPYLKIVKEPETTNDKQ